jgi:ketosteroid isomerase-like protein
VDAREWIERYARAWRGKDAEAAAALFTDDGIYRAHPLREPHVGREAIRAYWARVTSTQRELDLRFGEPVVEASRCAVEWWATMSDGEEDITLPGILMLRFAPDGRCEELRETWHAEPGRVDPPSGWGR